MKKRLVAGVRSASCAGAGDGGTGVTRFNTANAWWGEGGEKIFADGEAFPSFVGTGSEDDCGHAWSNGNHSGHPFITQPEGGGAGKPGLVINSRYRVLDAIPFRNNARIASSFV